MLITETVNVSENYMSTMGDADADNVDEREWRQKEQGAAVETNDDDNDDDDDDDNADDD